MQYNAKFTVCSEVKGKGKAIPLQPLDRPLRVPGRLRLPDFKTVGT
jgi:hypothetical protein